MLNWLSLSPKTIVRLDLASNQEFGQIQQVKSNTTGPIYEHILKQ